MSEKVFRIRISEIKTLRVTCNNCKTAVEVSIDNVLIASNNGKCRFCNEIIYAGSDLLNDFSKATKAGAENNKMEIEIVLKNLNDA